MGDATGLRIGAALTIPPFRIGAEANKDVIILRMK
jgi:hypothetical protein